MQQPLQIVKSEPLTITKAETQQQSRPSPQTRDSGIQQRFQAAYGTITPEENAQMHERGLQAIPVIAATATSALTGGLGAVPAIVGAGVGGAAGQAIKDTQYDMPVSQRVVNAAKVGASQAAIQGAGELVASAGPALKRGAQSLWNRAAKITEPVAKQTQTMRAGGSLMEGKREIADTVLDMGKGTISQRNLEGIKESINALDDQLDTIIANSKGFVKRQELRDALIARSRDVGQGTITQEQQQAALAKAFDLLAKKPVRMTLAEAQKTKRAIYAAYEKTFAADAAQAANAMADKTVARQLRTAIAREEPAVAGINEAMSKQIPAAKAMEKALSRGGNANPVTLTQTLTGMVTNPATVAAAVANHPGIASFTAQQIYRVAKALPRDGRTVANILRGLGLSIGGQ